MHCFVYLYLHPLSAIEHVSHGKRSTDTLIIITTIITTTTTTTVVVVVIIIIIIITQRSPQNQFQFHPSYEDNDEEPFILDMKSNRQ